ncbi:MAG: sulfotransferase [Myxococcales bacterium]|nr:sulfotransferase [Myxococcales bacterium]
MTALDPDILIETAQQLVRSDDLMGREWEPAFRVLVESLAREAGLRPARVETAVAELLGLLTTRGRVAALLRARPELRERPTPAPAIITGLPRTGTTLLHNLMAVVPGNRAYRLWELRAPAFAIDAPPEQARRELEATQAMLRWLYGRAPAFRDIHPMAADAPDECNWLLRATFTTPFFAWLNHVPSYERFLADADFRPAYRDWDLLLRALRWRSPGGAPVLKDPGHIWAPDALLATRPDARLIVTVRALDEVVGSFCSLCSTLQHMDADGPGDAVVGRTTLRLLERGLARLERAYAEHRARILLVDYREFVADPVATVERIQHWLDRPFDDRAAAACRAFLEGQPRHAPHRYSLARFGLRPEQLPALTLGGLPRRGAPRRASA